MTARAGALAAALWAAAALQGCGGSIEITTTAPEDKAVAFQGNAAHTGSSGVVAPAFPASAAWTRAFANALSYPLIADGRVFVLERGGQSAPSRLHALDRDSGSVVWPAVDLPGVFSVAGHAFAARRVFVSTFEGLVLAFDAASGQQLWSAKLPDSYGFVSAPTAIDGLVYTSDGGTNRVVALDAGTGALVWSTPVNGGGVTIPSVADGVVVVANPCQHYGLDAKTGVERWHYNGPCSGGGGSTVPIVGGTAYIRDRDEMTATPIVERRDAGSGASKGRWTIQGLSSQIPIPAATRSAVFVLEGATLRRYDPSLTQAAWSFAGDGALTTAPLVVDDAVIVASGNASLYAVDAANGSLRWSTALPMAIDSGNDTFATLPVTGLAAGEGTLIVPAGSTLTAFRLRP